MATLKRKRSPEDFEIENIILRTIFQVTLKIDDSPAVYLEMTAAKMLSEGKDPRLCRESMERVLIDRLSGDFSETELPFTYLVQTFRRACEEEKTVSAIKDKYVRHETEIVVRHAKNLAVSYYWLHLRNLESPQLPLWLLSQEAVEVDVCTDFVKELFKEADYESLKPILNQLYEDLRDSVARVSALGDFEKPFNAFLMLISFPVGAMALVDHLNGLSGDLNGREIEVRSVLGAFLHVSCLPDHRYFKSLPECSSSGSSSDVVVKALDKLRCCLAVGLHTLMNMNKVVCESILRFLALLINKNASRARIQVDPLSCASSGTFVNLSAIMLRLCEPFFDDPTERNRIDPSYVFNSNRLELRGLTAIHATSDQVSEWSKGGNTNQQEFHFACECFFMTARVLNLGLMKSLSHIRHLDETVETSKTMLSSLKARRPLSLPQKQEIAKLEKEIESYLQEKECYEAQVLKDDLLIHRALSFYRVMLVWMVDLAGGFKIPAPTTCPMSFAAIPEHFVDDAMELLIHASKIKVLHSTELMKFMSFIIMFMGSPEFIQNPYLRIKMIKVLYHWTLNKSSEKYFKSHQPTLDHLVRNLIQLYAISESTGSHLQFPDNLITRQTISKVLKCLWGIPGHRDSWKRIAKEEEKGVYLQFLNILMNDSVYMLDEGLNGIMNTEQHNSRARNMIKFYMVLANEYFDMICFTTEEIVAPFLVPEMAERVASMLNYFLARLMMMFQRSSTLENCKKYKFQPEELLKKIVKIYVNLAKEDMENVFAIAITKDGRSYNEQLFESAVEKLKESEEKIIKEFQELGRKARVATKQAHEAELAMGEIPEEFMDPIMSTLMIDPVILPNTNVRIDRVVILRHLLDKSTDPFSGLPLTADMLIPDTELKAKIDNFRQN